MKKIRVNPCSSVVNFSLCLSVFVAKKTINQNILIMRNKANFQEAKNDCNRSKDND
jgi:hypothetical protein